MTTDPENTSSDELATESSVHGSAGDDADATAAAEAAVEAADATKHADRAEPSVSDIKKAEAAMNPMQAVQDYSESKRA